MTSLPHVDDATIVIGRALAASQTQAVAWLSIDNLDRLDPETTLIYQRWIASLLVSLLPAGSVVGARPDGDFLLAIDLSETESTPSDGIDFTGAVDRLEYARAAVAQRRSDDTPPITISAGVVPSTGATSTIEVVANARAAFDHARKSGGNKVIKPGH